MFIGSCNGFFRALDSRTGSLVWFHDTREEGGAFEFHSDPLISGSLVIVGSDLRSAGATAYLYAFERETGAVRWKTAIEVGAATDLREFGRFLLTATLGDELLALDRETGQRIWSFASGAKREDLGLLNASPAILGERIFFGGFNGIVHALDVRTGRILWKQDLGSRVSAGVVADQAGVYVGTSDGRLLLLNPENGEVTARITTEGTPTGGLALAGQCLVSLLGEDALACYARSLERVRWIRAGPKPWTSSRPYVWKDLALAGNEAGEVFAFRLSDGEIAWSESLGETIRGIGTSPAGFYVGTLKGLVFARPWPNATMPAKRTTSAAQLGGSTFRQ